MAHPREEEVWPVDTVIRDKKTGVFGLIKQQVRMKDGSFQYYLVEIEGRKGQYCAIHSEWEFEAPPK
jgi:hypothetical protein